MPSEYEQSYKRVGRGYQDVSNVLASMPWTNSDRHPFGGYEGKDPNPNPNDPIWPKLQEIERHIRTQMLSLASRATGHDGPTILKDRSFIAKFDIANPKWVDNTEEPLSLRYDAKVSIGKQAPTTCGNPSCGDTDCKPPPFTTTPLFETDIYTAQGSFALEWDEQAKIWNDMSEQTVGAKSETIEASIIKSEQFEGGEGVKGEQYEGGEGIKVETMSE